MPSLPNVKVSGKEVVVPFTGTTVSVHCWAVADVLNAALDGNAGLDAANLSTECHIILPSRSGRLNKTDPTRAIGTSAIADELSGPGIPVLPTPSPTVPYS